MSIDFTFRPISQWPGKLRTGRRRSPFSASHRKNLQDLERELVHQRAKSVVIQLALEPRELRLDGMVRAGANPRHPGVILTFTKPPATTLNFPCDTYATWQENLRAIVLALSALRAVDRYGVTQNNEQYRGWAQLPGPMVTPPPMSVDEAAAVVGGVDVGSTGAWDIAHSIDTYRSWYRQMAKVVHPDTGSGDAAAWAKLQAAKIVMDRHHGIL